MSRDFRKDALKKVKLPSNEDLDHLEGLDWSRVNLKKKTVKIVERTSIRKPNAEHISHVLTEGH